MNHFACKSFWCKEKPARIILNYCYIWAHLRERKTWWRRHWKNDSRILVWSWRHSNIYSKQVMNWLVWIDFFPLNLYAKLFSSYSIPQVDTHISIALKTPWKFRNPHFKCVLFEKLQSHNGNDITLFFWFAMEYYGYTYEYFIFRFLSHYLSPIHFYLVGFFWSRSQFICTCPTVVSQM